ncbi:DUF4232 domain-containing protein [Streptomyces albireticuli]|uniref:DUF4232 domain-containing protein n=1 Tax=Streptomyces albireticuli TaxID=1940 RepID=A0A2A2DDP0_9ACTN|nr:DUF4232 domain-containing protein [Streptomyces albireticuli]MCD9144933.1 DUF4232 domain-containing protein [Streptomyces albireticuli]MCD9164359.1 DUF4232 domain-containing protein [Streptomyces albireticuli]MCD9194070.1 DUF4232 domain-containing protein [Streptomyces albireticuli]PAU49509.1 hypothetical protein CK936_07500 [Streptomyces albireticuli]
MRTSRTRTAALTATATAAVTLAMTAFGGPASAGPADTGAGSRPAPRTSAAPHAAASFSAAGPTATRACDGGEMSYSVLHRFPKQRGEHLLITATNADSKPCWVTSSPSVILGDTANVLPHSAKDAPGGTTRITVRPGGKVYSAVNLFTDGAPTRTAEDFSIAMRDLTGDTGPASELTSFDAKGIPSKFTWSDADVTNWNTAKPYDF